MPSPWDILDLEGPTEDLRVIKKAYARKLKTTRPDDDPAAFMALRDALDEAQTYAYYQHQHSAQHSPSFQISSECETLETNHPIEQSQKSSLEINTSVEMANADIDQDLEASPHPTRSNAMSAMDDLNSLMRDPFGRADKTRWTAIFEDPRLEAVDDASDFEDAFLYYLLDNFGYLDSDPSKYNQNRKPRPISPEIATHIFNTMGWRDSLSRPLYMQDQLEWLRRDLDVLNRSRHRLQNQIHPIPAQIERSGDKTKWIPIGIFCFYLICLAINAVSKATF